MIVRLIDQVLVSIQSLIMVDEPYYNEPGYERSRTSSTVNPASEAYTKNIRGYTMKWAILEQLRRPPKLFAEAVRRHFTIKAQTVLDVSSIMQSGYGIRVYRSARNGRRLTIRKPRISPKFTPSWRSWSGTH